MALAHDIASHSRSDDIKVNENADFTSLLLSEKTLCGLQKSGFRKPSPIQQQAIPIGKCGFDLVIRSKSGTGKTAVFAVIALEMIDITRNCIQCLIIAPTREIAVQIQGVIETIGSQYAGLTVHSFIGGMSVGDDTVNLQCCHVAVGTPGRLKHLIESGTLKTDSVKLLVLDEADKLMESSFYNDVDAIYYKLPKCFQMIASSATYPNNLDYYISQYMHTPTHINALNSAETPLLLGLRQFIATVRQTSNSMLEKNRLLLKLLSSITFTQCIIFSNYQTRAESVCNILNAEKFTSEYISAAQSQPERLAALAKLKSFQCRIILSTDLTARGIDSSNVDLVVNYDVPNDVCTYLHRMGRAGRYGSRGLCVTLAENGRELDNFKKIIGFLGGTNMSIPKLSNASDWLADDLWKGELLKFEQIYGVVTSVSNYNDVQQSLLELRQYKTINTSETLVTVKIDSSENSNDCASLNSDDASMNSNQSHKYSLEEISKFRMNPDLQHNDGASTKLCDVLEPLIESSNLNEINVSSILRRNCKLGIQHLNKSRKNVGVEQLPEEVQDGKESNDSGSKRKRIANNNSPSNGFMPQEKKNSPKSEETPDNVFQKNIGVLNVTRLLCDQSTEISADISENIGMFLNQLKGIGTTKADNTENINKTMKSKDVEENPSTDLAEASSQEQQESENELFNEFAEDVSEDFDGSETTQDLQNQDKKYIEPTTRFSEQERENISDRTEKLFQYAFDFALEESKPHWLEEINEDFDETTFDAAKENVEMQENLLEDFHNIDFDAMECDDDDEDNNEETYNNEDFDKNLYDYNRDNHDVTEATKNANRKTDLSRLSDQESTSHQNNTLIQQRKRRSKKLDPLLNQVLNETPNKNIISDNKYTHLLMDSGKDFLNTYKDYEKFSEFKIYWGNWKSNMESIRQVVQQKIYLEEMMMNKKFNGNDDSDESD